jgi:uncharacterized protein involved in exopolysaccharide biosynthesis
MHMKQLENKKSNLPVAIGDPGALTLADLADIQLRSLGLHAPMELGPGGAAAQRGDDFSIRSILYMVFRHTWSILFCFVAVAVATVIYVSKQPDKYISEARMLIRSERRGVTVDPLSDGSSHFKENSYAGSHMAEYGILQSWRIAEQTVNRLGVKYVLGVPETIDLGELIADAKNISASPDALRASALTRAAATSDAGDVIPGVAPDRLAALKHQIRELMDKASEALNIEQPTLDAHNLAVRKVMGGIQAASFRDSEVMIVNYTDYDPNRAQTVLNAIIDVYLAEHIEIFKSQISPEYFRSKAEDWKKLFDDKERELNDLRHRLNVRSFAEEKTAYVVRLQALENQISEMDIKDTANKARIDRMRELLQSRPDPADPAVVSNLPAPAPENSLIGRLQSSLIDLQLEEARMASIYTDEWPDLADLRRRIGEIRETIKTEVAKNATQAASGMPVQLSPAMIELQTRYQTAIIDQMAMDASRVPILAQAAAIRTRLDDLMSNDQQFQELMMQKSILEKEYKQYLNSHQIAEIAQTLDSDRISNVRVLQWATFPGLSTKSPRKMLALLGFGCFIGLVGGIAIAIAREMVDHSVKTCDDIEKKLGLTHLISIPTSSRIQPQLRKIEQ